jgi:hypothetical protein
LAPATDSFIRLTDVWEQRNIFRLAITKNSDEFAHAPFRPANVESTQYFILVFKAFCAIPHQFRSLTSHYIFAVPVENIIEAARLVEAEYPRS